jgi:DNA-binding transcriptional MerR regulator
MARRVKTLAIKDVAEQTGLAAGTIRMWEQRYGYPEPARTPAGYRVYTPEDVATLRRVLALRDRGLSVPAALEQARSHEGGTARASIFAALSGASVRPQRLRKRTLIGLSRAIEEEAIASAAGPVVIGSFQQERNYRAVEHRYRRLAKVADAVIVFAQFEAIRSGAEDEPVEIPIADTDAIGHEWAVVVDAPGRLPGGLGDAARHRRADLRGGVDDGARRGAPRRAGRGRPRGPGGGARAGVAGRPSARGRAPGAGAHRVDQPDDQLPGVVLSRSAPIVLVVVMPSDSAVASVRSQSAPATP